MSELRDRDAFWARLHERLDRREDPLDDAALLDWMAQHPQDAEAAAVLCERIAAAPRERRRNRVLVAGTCGAAAAALTLAAAWLADRSASGLDTSASAASALAAAAPPHVRVLAFEARSTAAGASFVEERVRDAAGERVTTIGADYATSRSATLAARDTGQRAARAE